MWRRRNLAKLQNNVNKSPQGKSINWSRGDGQFDPKTERAHQMNDVTTPTAEMQSTTTDDQVLEDHQTEDQKAQEEVVKKLEESVKKLITRTASIKKMHEPRAIIRLRKSLDENTVLVKSHIESLKKLGVSDNPLDAFEGISEQRRWTNFLKKLNANKDELRKRVILLNKSDEETEQQ